MEKIEILVDTEGYYCWLCPTCDSIMDEDDIVESGKIVYCDECGEEFEMT